MQVLIRMDNGDSYLITEDTDPIELVESLSDLSELYLKVTLQDIRPEQLGRTQISLKRAGKPLTAHLNKTLISSVEVSS